MACFFLCFSLSILAWFSIVFYHSHQCLNNSYHWSTLILSITYLEKISKHPMDGHCRNLNWSYLPSIRPMSICFSRVLIQGDSSCCTMWDRRRAFASSAWPSRADRSAASVGPARVAPDRVRPKRLHVSAALKEHSNDGYPMVNITQKR